ncbi:unnamed protein product [Dicrocoelium dendriticum]|nr:unnamed protein product [Dicrocoelium dendriticum]
MPHFIVYINTLLTVAISVLCGCNAQSWWNYVENINPYIPPQFTPLPNVRFTHKAELYHYGPMANDVIVNIPKAGMGMFIGFSTLTDYDYTWSQWPPKKGRLVNVFLGIPYAAPPTKDERFRVPTPAFLDTRYPWPAKYYRSACMQNSLVLENYIKNFSDFNEDCLYLNVFVPNRTWDDPTKRYPVVVHIHGGGFVHGSSHMYPGHVLASKGVVVVTFNYRLGPFGFLSTGDFASVGNYGLWDQLLALRWVKDNIEWFRGDPSQITLMGEGAGGASVGLHAISPVSRDQDLFHKLIIMSGSDLSHWAVSDPNHIRMRYYAIELGRELGCPSVQGPEVEASQKAMLGDLWNGTRADAVPAGQFGNSSVQWRLTVPHYVRIDAPALIRCLRYMNSADRINQAAGRLQHLRGATHLIWTPVLDGTAGFLPRMPLHERRQGRLAKLPLLAGVVHDEGSLLLLSRLKSWESEVPAVKDFTDDVARRTIGNILNHENVLRFNATAEELYTRYTWWPNLANNSARWERLVALVSDYEVNAPLITSLRLHAEHSDQVYFYEFAYVSPNDTTRNSQTGVYHGAEQPFLFGFPFMDSAFWKALYGQHVDPKWASQTYFYPHDTNMSELVMDMWVNFITHSKPTVGQTGSLTWEPYTLNEEGYLFIHLNSTMRYKFRSQHMAFWRERFHGLAEQVPPSPPLYFFPMFNAKLATVVLGCLVGITLLTLIVLTMLLGHRPSPDQFRHEIRLATPATSIGSVFQAAFRDAFSSRAVMYTPGLSDKQPEWDTSSSCITQIEAGIKPRTTAFAMSSAPTVVPRQNTQPASIRIHPPPPPVPKEHNRQERRKTDRENEEYLLYAFSETPKSSHRDVRANEFRGYTLDL